MKLSLVGLLFGAVLVFSGTASAASITIDAVGCGSCNGLTLDLEIIDNGATADVTLKYTAPSGFAGGYTSLVQAGFGGITGWSSATVDAITFAGADVSGAWSGAIASNISSNGSQCGGPAAGGKICLKGSTDLAGGGELIFSLTVTGGTVKSDTADWHIGGQVASVAAALTGTPRGRVISEDGPGTQPIPEPTAALAFAMGALVIGGATRRRS